MSCASGAWSTRVAATLGASQVVGVDLSTKGLVAAAERGMHPVYASVDGAVLPFANGSLDVVMCDAVSYTHLTLPTILLV